MRRRTSGLGRLLCSRLTGETSRSCTGLIRSRNLISLFFVQSAETGWSSYIVAEFLEILSIPLNEGLGMIASGLKDFELILVSKFNNSFESRSCDFLMLLLLLWHIKTKKKK